MYTIIGGDQKEYGPISADDVRQWIAEGRLNEKSLVKAESDAEFRALEKFPEFVAAFTSKTSTPGAPPIFTGSTGSFERDYDLDIGGCISRGWELVQGKYGNIPRRVRCLAHNWDAVGFVIMLGIDVYGARSAASPTSRLSARCFRLRTLSSPGR